MLDKAIGTMISVAGEYIINLKSIHPKHLKIAQKTFLNLKHWSSNLNSIR